MTRTISLAVIVCVFVIACIPSRPDLFPEPEVNCPHTLSWQGLVPGQSRRQDVIDTLGSPYKTGEKTFSGRTYPYYAYQVNGGKIADFVQDRIFFNADDSIIWIESVIADRDGASHAVSETIAPIGNIVDVAYWNSDYTPGSKQIDILTGPDQIYVRSECGLALVVADSCFQGVSGETTCAGKMKGIPTSSRLSTRYTSSFPGDELKPIASTNATVLMQFLFVPTTYDRFMEFYQQKVPFGLWNAYLR